MDEIATISHQYYDNHLRGGEGHMEVGKLIQSVEQRKSHMMISVKPFGCMPSSGVSDGVQSLVTARHADALFCAIETTGDGAVNVQSRVLMYLFKARQAAQREYDALREASGRSQQELETLAHRKRCGGSLFYPPHRVAGTASNALLAIDPRLQSAIPRRASATPAPTMAAAAVAAPATSTTLWSSTAAATAQTKVNMQTPKPAAPRAARPSMSPGFSPAGFRDGVIRLTPVGERPEKRA
jgi:hypothetical protein